MVVIENTLATYSKNALAIISFILFTLFLLVYSDKDGYEGDDLNSIVPAMHVDEMRAGKIAGYKYDWQPLSYQLSHRLYKITSTPEIMLMISPIAIAISLLILFLLVNKSYGTGLLPFLCLLLMLPEFIYTGLYFNSHAPACLVYILAVWALFTTTDSSNLVNRAIAIGALASISILFRFDYVLAFPILTVLFYLKTSSLRYSLVMTISAALVGLSALLMGVFNLSDLIEIYQVSSQEIAEKSSQGGWGRYAKTMALTVLFSPLGWLFFLTGTLFFLIKNKQVTRCQLTLIMLAILPMLYPFKDLLSVKYALPFLTWMLIFGAYLFKLAPEHLTSYVQKKLKVFCLFFSAFFLIVYVNIDNGRPYISLSFEPIRDVGTHDGGRSWGGYIQQFLEVRANNHRAEGYIEAKKLLHNINESKDAIFVIVGKQNVFDSSSLGWRYLQLFLAKQVNSSSEVIKKNHIRIQTGSNMVHLCEDESCLSAQELSHPNLKVVYPDYINL